MNTIPDKLEKQAYDLWVRLNNLFDRQLRVHCQNEPNELGPYLYRVACLCHRAKDRYERRWVDEA